MYDDDDDDLDEHGHGMGGGSSEDGDLTDGEGDDLLEDDMDKISSSPSIDDGVYILSPYWLDWDCRPLLPCFRESGLTYSQWMISISSSFMPSITLSLPSKGKQMQRREILWFFSMTVTPTGGSCESSRMAALVCYTTLLQQGYGSHYAGYLPAEHIETPTERLARLNKHRNVDVSQTRLA